MKSDERQLIEALYKVIGQNLQRQRILAGKNLLEIELITRIAAQAITLYEKGEKEVPVVDLVKLSQFFDISPALLFEGLPDFGYGYGEKQSYSGFSEAHIDEFQQNFLKVTGPERGDKFKRFIQKISDEGEE